MDKHAVRMALDRWLWHAALQRHGASRTAARVSWVHAMERYGADRFMKLSRDLGLVGGLADLLDALVGDAAATGGGGGSSSQSNRIAAAERPRLKLPMPFELNSPYAASEFIFETQSTFLGRIAARFLGKQDSDVEFDSIAELFACVRLIQVAFLVSSFAEEHVPEGCETERLESGSLLKFFNVRTGNSSFARARAMANVEALERLIFAPLGAEHQLRNDDVVMTSLCPSNGQLIKRFGDS
jgi:hypothetical protein